MNKQSGRIQYIDGIRGIASVLVVFNHLCCVFIPGLYYSEKAGTAFEHFWLESPLNLLTNGNGPVQCFFVLSGFLIASKIYAGKGARQNPLSHYYKLLRVVAPGVIFAALLMAMGLMFHLKAAQQNSLLSFVNNYNNFTPTVKSVFADIFYRTFFEKSEYVGPFWTISVEFLGSLVISAMACFSRNNKYSKLYYMVAGYALIFVSINLVSFIFGAFAFDCVGKENEDHTILGKIVRKAINNRIVLCLMIVLGLYLFSVNKTVSGAWSFFRHIPIVGSRPILIRAAGISMLVLAISKISVLQKVLSIRPMAQLGRVSAYTYAFHWPIILSLGCGLYLLLSDHLAYHWIVLIVFVSVLICSVALAYCYTLLLPKITLVENKLITVIKTAYQKIRKKQHSNLEK